LAYTFVLSNQFYHYMCKFTINWLVAVILGTLNCISGKYYFQ